MPIISSDDGLRVLGQAITLEFERQDRTTRSTRTTSAMNTIKKIAARHGGVKGARAIADYNGIRSIVFKMHPGREVKLPGFAVRTTTEILHVLAGDGPPQPTGGYAKWSVVDRYGRTGLMQFDGYDPTTLDIPIRFESTGKNSEGVPIGVEDDIAKLERMGGRGNFPGAGTGPPGLIKLTVTDGTGRVVPLVPSIYQSDSDRNGNPPKWVLVNPIQWDASVPDGVLRNRYGNRIRQKATITLQRYTSVSLVRN